MRPHLGPRRVEDLRDLRRWRQALAAPDLSAGQLRVARLLWARPELRAGLAHAASVDEAESIRVQLLDGDHPPRADRGWYPTPLRVGWQWLVIHLRDLDGWLPPRQYWSIDVLDDDHRHGAVAVARLQAEKVLRAGGLEAWLALQRLAGVA